MNEPANGLSRYRLEELERKVGQLSEVRTDAALLKIRIGAVEVDQEAMSQKLDTELGRIRRGLWIAAATFATLAVGVFSLILQGAQG